MADAALIPSTTPPPEHGDVADELFDMERVASAARRMARAQSVRLRGGLGLRRGPRLLLRESYGGLSKAYRRLVEEARREQPLTPAADWLLDNFYVIRDAARQLRSDLPLAYYRVLPKLEGGAFSGRPRIYEAVSGLAGRTDNVLDEQHLWVFFSAFQEVAVLELSELWALPAMARLVLLQRLAVLAAQVSDVLEEQAEAARWARQIVARAAEDTSDVVFVLAEMTERHAPLSGSFVVTLTDTLRAEGSVAAPALDWLERRLAARGLTVEAVVRQETQRQTHRQASVANAITSLRRVGDLDWSGLVESLAAVDHALRRDPAGVYAAMDFPTRDRYRHVVERLARYSPATELGVAERVVAMAEAAQERFVEGAGAEEAAEALLHVPPVATHVGYWLVGEGVRAVEREVDYRPPRRERLVRAGLRWPGLTYAGTIGVLFALLLLGAWGVAAAAGASGGVLLLTLAASVLPALDLAVGVAHWLVTRVFPPRRLPKLAFEGGVPPEHRTFIVAHTLLTSPEEARRQVERLEVHAHANPDPSFRFALLSSFDDAPEESMSGDAAILEAAREALRALNARWRARQARGDGGVGDRFFHLHRARRWNAAEGAWMGWERKRGQLEELNALLRDPDAVTTYVTVEGDFRAAVFGSDGRPGAVRYVVTLDADTQLPPGAARDLVRTAAHPLNRPVYDPERGRVVRGYGVLQPRIGIAVEVDRWTPFARIFSGEPGVDPYTTAVSDVYQDLSGVGIFTGKGLYDVDAFRRALDGAIPENAVLSHDLLEGNYARAGLVTDVLLFDAYPSSYAASARRLHRWARGDWQILPWLFGRVRDAEGRRRRNPVSLLGRWKTFDNLRRSLTPPSVLLFLLLGWTVLPGSPFLWTLLGVGILASPIVARFTSTLLAHPPEALWRAYLRGTLAEAGRSTLQAAFSVVFLAHQALLLLDAIGRSLWRMFVSRKRLLEWTTAQQAEALGGDAPGIWLSPLAGGGVLALVALMGPVAALVAVPFAAAWIAAPWVARRLSEPEREAGYALTAADRARLRRIARRTWRFFDDFVTEADHGLVPDNFQEHPFQGLARRTSPTNLGMGLLALQAAYDLGYATRTDAAVRLTRTFETLRRLERHGGHFYNWYDTETTEPLAPRYVSTVDSGNLVAALVTLRQALLEVPTAPWPNPALFDGLRDTLACLDEALADERVRGPVAPVAEAARNLAAALPDAAPERASAYRRALDALEAPARALADAADALLVQARGPDRGAAPAAGRPEPHEEVRYWAARPLAALEAARVELDALAPWAASPDPLEPLDAARSLGALLLATRQAGSGRAGEGLGAAGAALERLLATTAALADEAEALALAHDFRLLYDVSRDLFYIGYNADSGQADPGTYDLLASECRVASLVAVGKGDVEAEHWFRLGRPTTHADGHRTLVSWSGTAFEYLMPLLFTRVYPGSLLEETCRGAVGIQRAYARRWGRPWGLSESAYYRLDIHLTYQYRAFGVPGLGLKRGLSEDYVAAPYATLLGLLVRPDRALANLDRLRAVGAYGPYGYYEAVDFTPERVPEGQAYAVVRAYMAHHQGMGLLAIVNALTGASRTGAGLLQRRFHREPLVRSAELLLQERIPRERDLIVPHPDELEEIEPVEVPPPRPAVVHVPASDLDAPTPLGVLLANGRHTTFVTAAGAGFARVDGTALTRWAPDRTREHDGVFLYVRDVETGRYWSAGMQPCGAHGGAPDRYEAWFHLNKAEIARVDDWVETFTEVAVSPEDDVEVRRYTLTNYSDRPRELELTSYAEVVLTDPAADAAHPAFSKLFVRTEADPARGVLLATRRAREAGRQHPWLFHATCCEGGPSDRPPVAFETDRMRFVGRNRSLAAPAALDPGADLSGTTGAVLDPIVSLRRRLALGPKEKQQVTFVLGTAPTRDAALRLADRYRHPEAVQRAFDLAGVYGLVELPHFGLTGERALYAQQLATALLYGAPHLRASERVLMRNRRGQPGLWAYGISGDLPILVARVGSVDEIATVRALLQMHAYWRQRGLAVDLVVLNAHTPSYADEVQQQLQQAVEASASRGLIDRPGGVFVRRTDGMPEEDLTLLLTAARVVVEGTLPALEVGEPVEEPALLPHVREPLARAATPSVRSRLLAAAALPAPAPPTPEGAHPDTPLAGHGEGPPHAAERLRFFNGYGGFAPDGREYVVCLNGGGPASTPLPWTNVVANEHLGFLATESGLGMAWQGNSQMNRLTPWSNDPVVDPAEDALYLRDEDEGVFWSPTPQPVPGPVSYETRHGWGYTRFGHAGHDIESDVLAFVPRTDPVQVVRLRLTNRSGRPRRLTAFRYAAWVLGDRRERSEPFVVVRPDLGTGALFARNRYSTAFGEPLAFADAARLGGGDPTAGVTFTADRASFLGRGGSPANPAALRTARRLDGRLGAGFDPCAAFAVPVTLQPGETAEVVFLLGQAATRDEARALVRHYREAAACEAAFEVMTAFWRDTLGALQVETPMAGLDVLVNGWLLYQNLACRLWARSAFYQSGGAFGFRDQLQDACALLLTRPDLTRAQLLLHAARQFEEGDVLHWWHPQTGAGVRTRFSDDLLWLPYATATYLRATGDRAVLDEEAPFLIARALEPGEDEAYLSPETSDEAGTLFEHGCRALDRSLTEGPHGLPLMGSGDWNDGMNRVGHEGRGESVWLGFFLFDVLDDWIPLCEARGDGDRAARYRTYQAKLRDRLDEAGWDGAWYRRAYYDDGTPLGSAENRECRIDAIAQAWAVLSGAGDDAKVERALASARAHLVDEEAGIIRLLTPPFDETTHDPGYIKGYLPGVRENGGQYTHGVLWLVRAFAERGHGAYATRLLAMLLPTTDTRTQEAADGYMTEPYAVAADVYGTEPHVGRGGWTWYTGSAGWMYRVAVESILGLTLEGGTHLRLDPRIPADWPGFTVRYRRGETHYVVTVTNEGAERGVAEATLDGEALPVEHGAALIPLVEDGREHRVHVSLRYSHPPTEPIA